MVVNPILPVSVLITPDQNNICQGTLVTFTASPVNGGTPVYQWRINGVSVGSNQPVYSYFPANGDVVDVIMTSDLFCVTGSPASSNSIAMVVNQVMPVSVAIFPDQNNVCAGTSVTFTANPVNAGTPMFQWYINGILSGFNQSTFTYIPSHGDQVTLTMNSSLTCATGNPATSNIVSMAVNPIAGEAGAISGNTSVCAGSQNALYSIAPVANSSLYIWNLPFGANIVSGNNTESIVVNFDSDASSGVISVVGSNSCGNGTQSPEFPVTVNAVPESPQVTIQWPLLQSSAVNGNQWYYQDSLIPGANAQTYQALEPGWYWSAVTVLGCVSDTSNHVYVDASDPNKIEPGILVYPVPNDGHFTISIIVLSPETFDVLIFNALGEKLYEQRDILVTCKIKKEIDLRPKPNGVYSVVINGLDYQVVKKILIIKK
jgi:hypothetical protein